MNKNRRLSTAKKARRTTVGSSRFFAAVYGIIFLSHRLLLALYLYDAVVHGAVALMGNNR